MKDELIPKWMSASTTNVCFGHKGFLLQVSLLSCGYDLEWKEIKTMLRITQDEAQLVLRHDG